MEYFKMVALRAYGGTTHRNITRYNPHLEIKIYPPQFNLTDISKNQ